MHRPVENRVSLLSRRLRAGVRLPGSALLIALLVALAVALRGPSAPQRSYAWPWQHAAGLFHAADRPALLAAPQPGLLWRPLDSSAPLSYTALDRLDAAPVPVLPYPDVHPLRWQAVVARLDRYHLVWLEQDGRLRSALIGPQQATLRGPIVLALQARADFILLAQDEGGALLLWLDPSSARLSAARFDEEGRPHFLNLGLRGRIEALAAATDREGVVHLAWLAPSTAGAWTLEYRAGSDLSTAATQTLATLTISPGEALAGFAFGLDLTHGLVLWSTTAAAQPGIERVHFQSFPLDQPAQTAAGELRLPRSFDPSTAIPSDLAIGRLAPLPAAADPPADLRGVQPAPGQHTILPVAVARRGADGWRPAIVVFRAGMPIGYQLPADSPADARAPLLDIMPGGEILLAAGGLHEGRPRIFVARSGDEGLSMQPPDAGRALRRGVGRAPWGLLWMVLPALLWRIAPARAGTIPLASLLYGAAKLAWPGPLLARVPPVLDAAGLDRLQPGAAVGLALAAIAVVGALLAGALYRIHRSSGLRWWTAAVLDLLLTWAVFGANLPAILAH